MPLVYTRGWREGSPLGPPHGETARRRAGSGAAVDAAVAGPRAGKSGNAGRSRRPGAHGRPRPSRRLPRLLRVCRA